jgi:uncharacterized membrane protein
MENNEDKIEELLKRMALLQQRQDQFQLEIMRIKNEIIILKNSAALNRPIESTAPVIETINTKANPIDEIANTVRLNQQTQQQRPAPAPSKPLISQQDLEKFIGENLINKIGIIITVIGVGIGAKYAIDHELISPLTRIILGYLVGLGLLGFAIKLKPKYESFSAVLLSGAMAIMYLITFSAYSLYNLFPQAAAFGVMVLFTVFTVLAALNYNRQVIAHIGLVGAYAVPFLLSDGSGKVAILYSYMAIINTGILAIAIKKYWKPLLYVSFALTWLIYFSWYVSQYNMDQHFALALGFVAVFFAIFYAAFLAYKIIRNEKFVLTDVALILFNSILFYGIGYGLLSIHPVGKQLLGLFTLANAIIHFAVSVVLYKRQLADKQLFYLVAGLVLVFITIAIPVQLDGNWVTLLWIGEATLLFWIGRTKQVSFYQLLSYPLLALALFSILQDWVLDYDAFITSIPQTHITPLLNIHFLTSVLFIGCLGYLNFLNVKFKNQPANEGFASKLFSDLTRVANYALPVALVAVLYGAFAAEIYSYWNQLYLLSEIPVKKAGYSYMQLNTDLEQFSNIWLINYSLLFAALLSFVNNKRFKNQTWGFISYTLNAICILVFLTQGLYSLSELRDSYLTKSLAPYYTQGFANIYIRYISLLFVGLALYACYRSSKQPFLKLNLSMGFDIILHLSLLWLASSELINILALNGAAESYKLGISILWGIYALLLIALGIWKQKQHLRIGAIGLFAVTLAKLFFYDISDLSTIAKTIVFVSLGVLLLIISFLYNKYKHLINGNEPKV